MESDASNSMAAPGVTAPSPKRCKRSRILRGIGIGAIFLLTFRLAVVAVVFSSLRDADLIFPGGEGWSALSVLKMSFITAPPGIWLIAFTPLAVLLLSVRIYWLIGASLMSTVLLLIPLSLVGIQKFQASLYTSTEIRKPRRHHDLVAFFDDSRSNAIDDRFLNASEKHMIAIKIKGVAQHMKNPWEIFRKIDFSSCGQESMYYDADPFLYDHKICLKRRYVQTLDEALLFRKQSKLDFPQYDVDNRLVDFPFLFRGESFVVSEIIDGKELMIARRLKSFGERDAPTSLATVAVDFVLGWRDWNKFDQGPNINEADFKEFAFGRSEGQLPQR